MITAWIERTVATAQRTGASEDGVQLLSVAHREAGSDTACLTEVMQLYEDAERFLHDGYHARFRRLVGGQIAAHDHEREQAALDAHLLVALECHPLARWAVTHFEQFVRLRERLPSDELAAFDAEAARLRAAVAARIRAELDTLRARVVVVPE